MARMMNALQLALGSVGSGIQGYAQARAAREEQERQAQERADTLERQGRSDRLQAVMSGMVPSTAFDASNMVTGIPDMQGATPRQPAYEETFGGQKFVMPELPGVKAHREKIESAQSVKASDVVKKTALAKAWAAVGATPEESMAYANAGIDVPANRLAAAEKQLKPWEKEGFASEAEYRAFHARDPKPAGTGSSAKTQPTQEELDEAEAAWNSPLKSEMAPAFRAFRTAGDRRPPQVLMLAAYRALKARGGIPEELGGSKQAGGSFISGLIGGNQLGNPAAAGIPGGQAPRVSSPVTQKAPVAAAPTPTPKTESLTDQALEQDRQLWDAAVAQHGEDRVLARYGKRP